MKYPKFGKLKTVYTGKIFSIKQQEVKFPNNTKKIFEYCERPASVTILAFNEKNELLLIKERRHGFKKNVWFLPAGKVDKDDTPRSAALRELREETGYAAKKIKLIHQKSPSNTLRWDIFIFAARDLSWAPLKGDEVFPIELIPTPLSKAVHMAESGVIENEFIAYNIIRFDYMLRHKEFEW